MAAQTARHWKQAESRALLGGNKVRSRGGSCWKKELLPSGVGQKVLDPVCQLNLVVAHAVHPHLAKEN